VSLDGTQGTALSANASEWRVQLRGLLPGTAYDVFCMAQAAAETGGGAAPVRSSLARVLHTKLSVEMPCCKKLSVFLSLARLQESVSEPEMVRVVLEVPPVRPVLLRLQWTHIEMDQQQQEYFGKVALTKDMEFMAHIPGQAWSVVFDALTDTLPSGTYHVNGSLTYVAAADALKDAEFSVAFPTGTRVVVLAPNQAPPPPNLLRASFEGGAAGLRILLLLFDSAGDKYGSGASTSTDNGFACSTLLSFAGASEALCQWAPSGDSLQIRPSTTQPFQLLPGAVVVLKGNLFGISRFLIALFPLVLLLYYFLYHPSCLFHFHGFRFVIKLDKIHKLFHINSLTHTT
jgi:hypothetical protein